MAERGRQGPPPPRREQPSRGTPPANKQNPETRPSPRGRPPGDDPPGKNPPPSEPPHGSFSQLYPAPDAHADLERAINLLKQGPLFRNTSRRLLFDVAERSAVRELSSSPEEGRSEKRIEEAEDDPILAIVVLQGTLIAASKRAPLRELAPCPSPLPPDFQKAALDLEPGVHLRGELEERFRFRDLNLELGDLSLVPPSGRSVRFLPVTISALGGCPAVAWSMHANVLPETVLDKVKKSRRPELIWMATPPTLDEPLEPLMHIVAAQIASDLPKQPVALVTLDATPETLRWNGTRFEDAKIVLDKDSISKEQLYDLVGGKDSHGRVFVLNPKDPMSRPGRLDTVKFDKVIYVTDAIPDTYPASLEKIINTHKLNKPSFNAFVSTVITKSGTPPATAFEALPISSANPATKKLDPKARLVRDGCVVRLSGDLNAAWNQWMPNGGMSSAESFLFSALDSGAVGTGTVERWSRAVTQRQVGLAVSGGGAGAYRIAPILKELHDQGVPIDVFSGLSGSALIGAFYCCNGAAGFDTVKCLGPLFQLTLPLALMWTWPLEAVVNLILHNARVQDMETRFAAVSVALPDVDRPQAGVVVKGSLGAAVRTSGALPPSFAPATKNCVRYTDGGAGTVVPARVTRDYGADVTIAVNGIPGPLRGNPFGIFPGGWLLHRLPYWGRMLDSYTWYAFFWEQTSTEFGREAEVFVDFEPQEFPMLESTAFIAAQWIATVAAKQTRLRGQSKTPAKIVAELKARWEDLHLGG